MEYIAVSHVFKSFGNHRIFEDFSLNIPMHTTTSLMAPSGAGKTTLLRLLMGLESPDQGRIIGMERKRISTVFQEPRLCENLSASANIRLVRKKKIWDREEVDVQKVSKMMEQVGLTGLENQPVREMSGGMRQRVALLRALYARWDVLFLDEPFQGLDWECKKQVMEYTKQVCMGKTVILVTHSEEEAEKMGKVIPLHSSLCGKFGKL